MPASDSGNFCELIVRPSEGHRYPAYCAKPMQPEAIDSGALNVSCQTNRNDSNRPARGPYISRRYRTGPPASGNVAPSSAHTRPSHATSAAPSTQPSMACGPCMAAMMRGMVMNGPTPIMSIMFRAVACHNPMPRIR